MPPVSLDQRAGQDRRGVARQVRDGQILGIADVAGKYWLPQVGAFIIYFVTVALLLWRPYGLLSREAGR